MGIEFDILNIKRDLNLCFIVNHGAVRLRKRWILPAFSHDNFVGLIHLVQSKSYRLRLEAKAILGHLHNPKYSSIVCSTYNNFPSNLHIRMQAPIN
jgi:hypothetical protein